MEQENQEEERMDLQEAKNLLIESAVGSYDEYEKISTWKELLDAAQDEIGHISAREETLRCVADAAIFAIEDAEYYIAD